MREKRNTGVRNLYQSNNGYYVYRNPVTGKRHGAGRDRVKAIADAILANERFTPITPRMSKMLEEVQGTALVQIRLAPDVVRAARIAGAHLNITLEEWIQRLIFETMEKKP